jgi:hypothetical protein
MLGGRVVSELLDYSYDQSDRKGMGAGCSSPVGGDRNLRPSRRSSGLIGPSEHART